MTRKAIIPLMILATAILGAMLLSSNGSSIFVIIGVRYWAAPIARRRSEEAALVRSSQDGPRIGYCINYETLRKLKALVAII